MTLCNAEIFNAYEAAGELLDREMPVAFAFKISRLIKALEPVRMAIQVCVEKIKDSDGVPDHQQLQELLRQTADVDAPVFTEDEITAALGTATPKSITSLMPFVVEDSNG